MIRNIPCRICGESKNFFNLIAATGNRGVPFISKEHKVALCQNCGVCFLNPQHEDGDYKKYYEWHDRPVDRKVSPKGFRPGTRGEYDRLRLDFFTKILKDKNARILDIGSGYGRFLKSLEERGYRNLHGLEPNREAVKVAEENYGYKFYNAGLGDASLPEKEFDAATLIAVIEHFTDPVKALRDMYKLLRPGGYLYVNTPNLEDVVLRQGINKYFKFVHTFYFTEKSLKNALKKAGFEIAGSYTLPADRRFSNLLCPENYSNSELNIIAKRPLKDGAALEIEKEDWKKIRDKVRSIWRKDKYYALTGRLLSIWRHRKFIGYPAILLKKKLCSKKPLTDFEIPETTG